MISHEYGFMLVHIPFTGSKSFEEDYVKRNHEFVIASSDTKKLAQELPLEGNQLAKTIKQFYDYDLFAIVKSPYLRAVEMWINAQPKLRECGVGRLTLGNYYENLLNKWKFAPDDKIDKQVDYLKSINGMYFNTEVDVNVKHLFKYEFLVEGNMVELNEFLKSLGANGMPFYHDSKKLDDTWDEYYDDHAIEMVNYIFAEDFEVCGYSKL
tara:strand:- start:3188 stop:3817 length:630 start_codon:yes stop_codon:yes gene_type:complete